MPNFTGKQKGFWSLPLVLLVLMASACFAEEANTQEQPAEATAQENSSEATPDQEVTEAEAVLAAALAEAEDTDRLVFLHTGADW